LVTTAAVLLRSTATMPATPSGCRCWRLDPSSSGTGEDRDRVGFTKAGEGVAVPACEMGGTYHQAGARVL